MVTDDELIVHRPLVNVYIKRSDIRSVELIDKKRIKGSFRIFGVGGLFGYFGGFSNFSIGRMTWYVTRRDKPVLVTTINGKKIIVTPDESDKFVAEFNS
jgi:hypothetical protein